MDRKPFTTQPKCPKCWSDQILYSYKEVTTEHPHAEKEADEYLALKCLQCEYTWQMDTKKNG